MPYVDFTYYRDTFRGIVTDEATFLDLEVRASEIIDSITMYSVAQTSLSNYATFIQEQFKKAVCAEIDYIDSNGGVNNIDDESNGSVSLGKFSYSNGSTSGSVASKIPHRVTQYLALTGLMYRGIDRV